MTFRRNLKEYSSTDDASNNTYKEHVIPAGMDDYIDSMTDYRNPVKRPSRTKRV